MTPLKQEAKKVITELQTSYDDLLQKYAAAENALDKVRFGIKPVDEGCKQEAFTVAEKVAEKIASYEIQEKMFLDIKNDNRRAVTSPSNNESRTREKIIGISNQVDGRF